MRCGLASRRKRREGNKITALEHGLAQLGTLPLRPERPCLAPCCAEEPTASRLARISRARSRLTSTTNSLAAVLSNRTSCRHHGQPTLGMAEQVPRGDHDGEILDRTRPDQVAPARPQFSLVGAGRHEDQFGAPQGQRACRLRHIGLAAHAEPDVAVACRTRKTRRPARIGIPTTCRRCRSTARSDACGGGRPARGRRHGPMQIRLCAVPSLWLSGSSVA